MKKIFIIHCSLFIILTSCRQDVPVIPHEEEQKGEAQHTSVAAFYLLNEGNMGSNKATLDYYDYASAIYRRNIYAEANPNVPKELGDVGNDLQVYGSRLYAVINCSNKVEVLDARTCKRIGQIDIPNCRYIRFHDRYAYVTSYAGPVEIKPDYEQIGYVAKIDTATLQEVARCLVGYQPDELCIVGNRMYVANSGGYRVPNYEKELSVIDLTTFTEVKRIPVGINLHRVRADRHGQLWVTARGDYYDNPSRLYCIDLTTETVSDSLNVAVSDLDIVGDSLYLLATEWSYIDMQDVITYGIVDVKTHQLVSHSFITDGTEKSIQKPYGLRVNPVTGDIYVTDAKNYVTPGTLYAFSKAGVLLWSVRTGDIPAHLTFVEN